MTITQYGGPSGVEVTVGDGYVLNTIIGRPQKLVVFGPGNPQQAQAQPNEPIPVNFGPEALDIFGDSPLTRQIQAAIDNGAQKRTEDERGRTVSLLYGVMPERISVVDEQVTGKEAVLSHSPIEEEIDSIEVERASDNTLLTVEWRYEHSPNQPQNTDTAFVNPHNGTIMLPDKKNYNVSYHYHDWKGAMEAARKVINPLETGMWGVLSEARSIASTMSNYMDDLRKDYRMVRGVMGAQPNKTGNKGNALLDPSTYTDPIDDDASWLAGNPRLESGQTVIGGIAGMFAGHDLRDPVFGDEIKGYTSDLVQHMIDKEMNTLRQKGVMPLSSHEHDIILEDSCSTFDYVGTANYLEPETLNTWIRDFHRRRVVDQVILMGHAAGKFGLKRRLTEQTLELVEQEFVDDIETFIQAGLLEGNGQGGSKGATGPAQTVADTPAQGNAEDDAYSVEVIALAPDTIGIAATVTPVGVAKHAEVRLSIAKQSTTRFAEVGTDQGANDGKDNTTGGGGFSAQGYGTNYGLDYS